MGSRQNTLAIVMSLVAFVSVGQMRRIDRLELSRATKQELQEKFDSLSDSIDESKAEIVRSREELREDMRESREETREDFRRVFDRLEQIAGNHRSVNPRS